MKILNSKNHVIHDIYQYDVGIYVDTDGISNDGFMHFSKTNSEADIVSMAIEDGKAQVPNQMFEKAGTLYIYVYDEERTLHAAKTEIIARPKPPEYVEDPTPVITYPELVELVEELERYKNLSADVDANTGTPSVEVEQAEDGYILHFHNLKGDKGDKGDPGEAAVIDPTLSVEGEAADAKAAGDVIKEINRRTIGVNHVSNQTILQSAAADDENAVLRLVGNDGVSGKVYAEFVFESPDGEGPLRVCGIEDPDENDSAVNKRYADIIKAIAESKYTLPINGIPTSDIAAEAVTNAKIAPGTVGGERLKDSAVYASKIANGAVTSVKIYNGAVSSAKLANSAVTKEKLATGVVDEIEGKKNKPTIISQSAAQIELTDNTEYYLSNISTIDFSYPEDVPHWECYIRLSTAASGMITITLPTSSYIGTAPVFANGETWELSIKDGVVVSGKVVSE